MQLKDIMTRETETCRPDATLVEVSEQLKQRNVGSLPVCDGDKFVGMLTDRDIVVRGLAERRDPNASMVRDIMSQEVVYAFEDQDVRECARLMEQRKVRRLPILDRSNRLVGIISIDDLAARAHQMEKLAGEVLAQIAETESRH